MPRIELMKNNIDKFLKRREVTIVGAKSPGKFPNPFHNVQVGTVRRKEVKAQHGAMIFQPRFDKPGVMPTGIIQNNEHQFVPAVVAHQLFQEG